MERVDGKTKAGSVSSSTAILPLPFLADDFDRSHKQCETQAELPVTLIPIRIDLDIQPFRPDAPLPTPNNVRDYGIDESLPAYRYPEITPQYRLKDMFLWNLHEALITPDQFAKTLVDELDFPSDKKPGMIG